MLVYNEPYIGKDVAIIRIGKTFYGFEVKEEYKRKAKRIRMIKSNEEEIGT